MQTAIATVCLSGTLGEKLEAIAAAKFKFVEIFENDLLSFNGSPAQARAMIEGLGLSTITLQPFRDFEGMPEPQRARGFARATRKFDMMAELGTDLLMVCSNVSPESEGGVDRLAADLRELGELAAQRGMRVAYEALAWGRHINDYRDAWEVVRRADHPAVGLVLDSFHVLARGTDLRAIRSIPKDRIFLVQIADAPKLDMDYLSWSRHYRCFPGQGDLPVNDFMVALQATGYDGPVSLEIFNDRFRAGSTRSVAVDGHRSLIFMLDEMAATSGKPEAGRVALPPRARVQGVEFVEFTLDDAHAADFERALTGLGFHKSGQHRSKAVERWTQGEVNLILNREKEGFAHSFNITHGASVCALALKVSDAARTLARAVSLLDQPFHQQVAPGEIDIPAVRGVGGSLIYFVDPSARLARWFDVDFKTVAEPGAAAGAGIVRFDHISQSMQYEEMLTWLLFYNSLFDVSKSPVQDVLDPGGVVQSQVVETGDGALRLVLNGSQSRQTLSSRFLSELFGSGVQHIALGTDDIFATAAALRKNGVPLLAIPENYYDDLEARTGLSDDEIARLRDHNILYDREGAGEFFQIYTQNLAEGGFFFEIVQRRAYRGFGAANAPIRLAAQTRLQAPATVPRF